MDVVRTIETKDSLYYFCVNDVQEESLFVNLDELVKNNLISFGQKNKSSKNILKVMLKDYLIDNSKICFKNYNETFVYSFLNVKIEQIYLHTDSPPPEI